MPAPDMLSPMSGRKRVSEGPARHTELTPERRRAASDLLKRVTALDAASDPTAAEEDRASLLAQASDMGMRVASLTITEEPIPDPAMDALLPIDRARFNAIWNDMFISPHSHVADLEQLVERYPNAPILRNQFAVALERAGQRERARNVIAETARLFPRYLIGICNHAMVLVTEGKIDEARALLEEGPRPLLMLVDFDPPRDTFHISEVVAHAAMLGHYLLATGRFEDAQMPLELLEQIAPDSAQYERLAMAMLSRAEIAKMVADLMPKVGGPKRTKPRAKQSAAPGAKGKTSGKK